MSEFRFAMVASELIVRLMVRFPVFLQAVIVGESRFAMVTSELVVCFMVHFSCVPLSCDCE